MPARFLCLLVLCACGSKTGLLIPELIDEPPDANVCRDRPLTLQPTAAEVLFLLDRSTSMTWSLDEEVVNPAEPSRWELMGDALEMVLTPLSSRLEVGAVFFPAQLPPPSVGCEVNDVVDILPGPGNVPRLLAEIRMTLPSGGTPTGAAIETTLDYIRGIPREEGRPAVVLATDGAPNCNPSFEGRMCSVCTSPGPGGCVDPMTGWINCLDDVATLNSVRELFEDEGVPVYVIGIGDGTRPAFREVLQQMAIAGGRPVSGSDELYYTVRRPDDLRIALDQIAARVAQCRFALVPAAAGELTITLGSEVVPRDETEREGWNHPGSDPSLLQLFGSYCDRFLATGGPIEAAQSCLPEI